jgi:tetratricopeptide (TPR) repeat protein
MAQSQSNLGALLDRTGRLREAEEAFRAALALQKQLVAEFPKVAERRSELAVSHSNLGILLRQTGRPREAEEALCAARDHFGRLLADFPAVPHYRGQLAITLGKLALLKGDSRDYASARQLLEQARPHHLAALQANPKNQPFRDAYSIHLARVAEVFLGLGDHEKAADAAEELSRFACDPATDSYDASCFASRCVPLVMKDARLTEAKRQELARGYADRAMTLLRRAVQQGFKDSAHMKKDTDLDPLRARDDFRKLLQELEAVPGQP